MKIEIQQKQEPTFEKGQIVWSTIEDGEVKPFPVVCNGKTTEGYFEGWSLQGSVLGVDWPKWQFVLFEGTITLENE